MSDPANLYALGRVGSPIRGWVEMSSRLAFVLAQLEAGEVAFPVPDRTRRDVTQGDADNALTAQP